MAKSALELLLARRSVVANKLGPPGPTEPELARIFEASARAPDHKKLSDPRAAEDLRRSLLRVVQGGVDE